MRVILVGQAEGKRRIRWGATLLVAAALGICCALCTCLIYFGLSGAWSPVAAAIGFFSAIVMMGVQLLQATKLPVKQLLPIDGDDGTGPT